LDLAWHSLVTLGFVQWFIFYRKCRGIIKRLMNAQRLQSQVVAVKGTL